MVFNLPSPLQKIEDELFEKAGVRFFIKRDDLIHPQISGNKWRKLKFNLLEAEKLGKKIILTFGGAYSNHIYATASAGQLFDFQTIGIIRGEETLPLNPTLEFAKKCGMKLFYLNRMDYREKDSEKIIGEIKEKVGEDFYLIPEGGSNELAVKGCEEILNEIGMNFDYICCPCGTGTTFAGIVNGLKENQKAIGFSVLKGLKQDISAFSEIKNEHYEIMTDYHFGGYAKTKPELLEFMTFFEKKHTILLEQVYTAKMMFGIYDLIKKGFFKPGETIIALHTGGLQGRMKNI